MAGARKNVVPVVVYDVRTSQKIFEDVHIPHWPQSRNTLILVQQPLKILKFQQNPGKPKGKPSSSRLHNLAFSLDLPGIASFFEAAGLKSRYFEIEGYVHPRNFSVRSLHHKLTLGPLFSCPGHPDLWRTQLVDLAPREFTYSGHHTDEK